MKTATIVGKDSFGNDFYLIQDDRLSYLVYNQTDDSLYHSDKLGKNCSGLNDWYIGGRGFESRYRFANCLGIGPQATLEAMGYIFKEESPDKQTFEDRMRAKTDAIFRSKW